jgi:hypothetical protein
MGRILLLASILMTLASPAAMAQSIGGDYSIEGTNLDGSNYGGTWPGLVMQPRSEHAGSR